jgi:hypothetical protein
VRQWQLLLLLQSLLLLLLPVAQAPLLLPRKLQLKKKRKTKALLSKASDPSSVEAPESKRKQNLVPTVSGGYEIVRTLAAFTGGCQGTAHPFLVQNT